MVVMRSDEMLLNAAEALARQGKEGEAKELLWQLQDLRNAKRTESTGDQLIEDILVERRKELYGEGFAVFDLFVIRNHCCVQETMLYTEALLRFRPAHGVLSIRFRVRK